MQVFDELVISMAKGEPITDSEELPDYTSETFNWTPGYGPDTVLLGRHFGDVLRDVDKAIFNRKEKDVVSVRFAAGNPRNNVKLDDTFLTVEQKQQDESWKVVRTDDDYDTKFHWAYKSKVIGTSHATIEWALSDNVERTCIFLFY